MKIMYITYIDMESEQLSGSSVRPNKMLNGFKKTGHEIYLLSGSCENRNRKFRQEKVNAANEWLDNNTPDLCYIESSTYPIMLRADRKLLVRLSKMNVPTGYFYRDFYRMFPDLYPRRKGFVNFFKEKILDYLQLCTDNVLKKIDIVYVPSAQSAKLFNYKDIRPLPPGGENNIVNDKTLSNKLIYVGAISEHYGFDVLMEAFRILNKDSILYKLILVCRKAEWEAVSDQYNNIGWLEVNHTSGEGLKEMYSRASVALIPKPNNPYNNLAISVKLFEYMGYGLPIISTSSEATDALIKKYKLGMIVDYNSYQLAEAIRTMLQDEKTYMMYKDNTEKALLNENLWEHRVEQIICDLARKDNDNKDE